MGIKQNELTLEEKVGQMLMFAFHGTTFNEQLKTQLENFMLVELFILPEISKTLIK